MALTPKDLALYRRRVQNDAAAPRVDLPNLETLRHLMKMHISNVPFENLSVLLQEPVSLARVALRQKMLIDGRGGCCFEQGLLFLAVLRALGYNAWPCKALMRLHLRKDTDISNRTHLFLVVDLAATANDDAFRPPPERWLVDIALGSMSMSCPVRLDGMVGTEQATADGPRRIRTVVDECGGYAATYRLEARRPGDSRWRAVYDFESGTPVFPPTHLEADNARASSATSDLSRRLIVTRYHRGRRLTLRDLSFTERNAVTGLTYRHDRLGTPSELKGTLHEHFHLAHISDQDAVRLFALFGRGYSASSKLERAKKLDSILQQNNAKVDDFRTEVIQQQVQRGQFNESDCNILHKTFRDFMKRKIQEAENNTEVSRLRKSVSKENPVLSRRRELGKDWQRFLMSGEDENNSKLSPFLMQRRPRIILDGVLERYCAGMDGTTGGNWPVDGNWSYQFESFGRASNLKANSNETVQNPAEFELLVEMVAKKRLEIEKELQAPDVLEKLILLTKNIVLSANRIQGNREEDPLSINYTLHPNLKVLDVGCGKGRWLAMASTYILEEIKANLNHLEASLAKASTGKWKIYNFIWRSERREQVALQKTITGKTKSNQVKVNINIEWFPQGTKHNQKNQFLWHGITGGNKVFYENHVGAKTDARLHDPSCNKIVYDRGVMSANDALELGIVQLENSLRKKLQIKKERIAMIKEDLAEHRESGFNDWRAEDMARLCWSIKNTNLQRRGVSSREKTQEEKLREDAAWTLYKKAEEEATIQKELTEFECSPAIILQSVPFECPSTIPIEPIFQPISTNGRGFERFNRYDLIVSSWTFRHLADPLGSLEFYANLLSPGGEMYINGFMMNIIEPGNNVLIDEEVHGEETHDAIPQSFRGDLCNLCMSDIIPGVRIDKMLADNDGMELGVMLITERPKCKEVEGEKSENHLKNYPVEEGAIDQEEKTTIEKRENAKRRGVVQRMLRAIAKLNALGAQNGTFTLKLDFKEVDKYTKIKKEKDREEKDLDPGSITYRTALKLIRGTSSLPIRFGEKVEYVGLARSDHTLHPFCKWRTTNKYVELPTRTVYFVR